MRQQFEAERQSVETLEKGHGRVESLRLMSTMAVSDYLNWPGMAQVGQITRRTTRGDKTTTEVHYAICSVPRSQANADLLLQWWRGHWGIGNRLHWVRDVTFAEDASRIRTRSAPQVFSSDAMLR